MIAITMVAVNLKNGVNTIFPSDKNIWKAGYIIPIRKIGTTKAIMIAITIKFIKDFLILKIQSLISKSG